MLATTGVALYNRPIMTNNRNKPDKYMPSGKRAMGDSSGKNTASTKQRNDGQEQTIDSSDTGLGFRVFRVYVTGPDTGRRDNQLEPFGTPPLMMQMC